jgi:hypothetical protein
MRLGAHFQTDIDVLGVGDILAGRDRRGQLQYLELFLEELLHVRLIGNFTVVKIGIKNPPAGGFFMDYFLRATAQMRVVLGVGGLKVKQL